MTLRPEVGGHGPAVWSSDGWRRSASGWLDAVLAGAGIERTGAVEAFRVRPWGAVFRAATTGGTVWFKAAGPGTAFEVGLYEVLSRVAPRRVLTPIATDRRRAWLVLPDAGPPLGARLAGPELAEALGGALVDYARLQIDLAPHVDELLAAGVPDMRPALMPQRFAEALDQTAAGLDDAGRRTHRSLAAMAPTVAGLSAALERFGVPPSLDHHDLHQDNVVGGDGAPTRFYDWGDAVIAHPFTSLFVPLVFVRQILGAPADDPAVVRMRDRYLDVFRASGAAPVDHAELVATAETACHLAKVARTLVWERALGAARAAGEPIPGEWAMAPLQTLASVLDPSPLPDF